MGPVLEVDCFYGFSIDNFVFVCYNEGSLRFLRVFIKS